MTTRSDKYEIIESKRWKHESGKTASLYGALPWSNNSQKTNWHLETVGWTVRNKTNGAIGIGRIPFKTHDEALEWLGKTHGAKGKNA